MVKIFALILIVLLLCNPFETDSAYLESQWGIILPEPDRMNDIFMTDCFQDGWSFSIWEYDEPITLPDDFQEITSDNIKHARSLYDRFLNELANFSYMHEYALVQKNFSKDRICEGNFYCKKTDDDSPDHRIYMFYDSDNSCIYELLIF